MWRWGRRWCRSRRDTRGKRGYDGVGAARVWRWGRRRAPFRRPRLDLGPIRRLLAGRGPERSCERGWRVARDLLLRTMLGLGPRSSLGRREGGGGMQRGCRARRDTRGKRGYDGVGSGAGAAVVGGTESRAARERRWRMARGLRPAHGVGFGPQIKSGATERERGYRARRDTPVRAGGRLRGKRGYDGSGGGAGGRAPPCAGPGYSLASQRMAPGPMTKSSEPGSWMPPTTP